MDINTAKSKLAAFSRTEAALLIYHPTHHYERL